MPYTIVEHAQCPASKPYGVITEGDASALHGCHATRAAARKQQAALYAATANEKQGERLAFPMVGYLDPEDVIDSRVYAVTERFLVLATNILSRTEIDRVAALHRLVDEYMDHMDDWQD